MTWVMPLFPLNHQRIGAITATSKQKFIITTFAITPMRMSAEGAELAHLLAEYFLIRPYENMCSASE